MQAKIKKIQIAGDVTVDWMIMNPRGGIDTIDFSRIWGAGITCKIVSQAGGAALLSRLIEEIIKSEADTKSAFEVAGPVASKNGLKNPAHTEGEEKTFSDWSLFPVTKGSKGEFVWRISDFLGQDGCATHRAADTIIAAVENADYLVIDDSNLGFRDNKANWPRVLTSVGKPKEIILKMAFPLAVGNLWSTLAGQYSDRLTVVVSVNDLRKDSSYIGYALSWEQIFEEIVDAIKKHALSKAARVIVCIGTSGAVIIERNKKSCLVFAPFSQEGDWEKSYPGFVMGYTTCMAGALLLEAIQRGSSCNWRSAAKRGLQAARTLLKCGYEHKSEGQIVYLQFPFGAIADTLKKEPSDFAAAEFQSGSNKYQSILTANLKDDYLSIAMEVAAKGPEKALRGIPMERVGVWSSVDRVEIESIRSVRNIMAEYISHYKRGLRLERPLSIAVFGPPGAGKSFAIKQVAKALLPGELNMLEFNLSQFKTVNELSGAFHRIRDLSLSQYLPLVFWDEFDTPLEGHELGWLRHFLAPMQDGEFREEGVPHPIGPAVFVFAGGTCASLQEFETVKDVLIEKNAKKPDFISRLRGYVNILGPNQCEPDDKVYPIRRAFLLWSLLSRKAKQLFGDGTLKIDPGVLRAFIGIDKFLHGARSMEAIIDMSILAGKLRFERSSLPARHQLALHVDADAFLALVKSCEDRKA